MLLVIDGFSHGDRTHIYLPEVQDDSPPAFIVHADNDSGVPAENSILMYEALRKKKIPAELHILDEGEHGFGLGLVNKHVASWTSCLHLWLNWLNQKKNLK